ncbi:MAG: SCO family protein [Gammaproteobacteria bacterium]
MSCIRFTANPGGAIAAALLLFSTLSLLAANPAGAAPQQQFPNVPLTNQDGETLHFYDDVIKGKVVSINFMFTSCGDSCPLETAKLRKVQQQLGEHAGKDVYMYSITVDPDRDTPAALKAYMQKFNIGPGWQFLTGKKADIDQIRKRLGMYSEEADELSDHAINFVLGNEATGQWLRRTPFDLPETLVSVLLGRLQQYRLASSAAAARPSYALSRPMPAARPGEDLFNTRCTACHTIGQGDKLGPDLLGVVSKRDRQWLIRWLQEPDVMLKEKDPLATALYNQYGKVPMPNVKLTDKNALDLIEYMQAETLRVNALSEDTPAQADSLESIDTTEPAVRTDGSPPPGNEIPQEQARADSAPVKEISN